MGKNTQRLGAALASRMKKTAGAAVPVTVELGTINKNLSLSVDSLKTPIPKGGYMVNIAYSGESNKTSEFRPLKKGDRVLVVWSGFEPVVLSIIVKS